MPLELEDHESPILAPGQKFGQFVVVEEIGSGGMGQVYKVRHTTFDDDFALKILHSDIIRDPAAMVRLRNEAKTGYRLKHKNVVGIDEFNEAEGRFYIRMPLMRGFMVGNEVAVSLKQVIKQNGGRLQEGDASIILRDILTGLAFAHQEKVVHRDLKPANILFNGQIALISDFGLVRIVGEDFFRSKLETIALSKMPSSSASSGSAALIGTYNFMAPEQRMAKEADLRSDIYAIGLIALNMITGSPNFGMKAPSKTLKGLSREWDEFLAKALEQDPADRFQNGGEMLDAMPCIDAPPSLLTERVGQSRQRKIVAKKKSKLPIIVAVSALALAVSGAAAFFVLSSNKESDKPAKVEEKTPAQRGVETSITQVAQPSATTPENQPQAQSLLPSGSSPQAAPPSEHQTPSPVSAEPAAQPSNVSQSTTVVAKPEKAPQVGSPTTQAPANIAVVPVPAPVSSEASQQVAPVAPSPVTTPQTAANVQNRPVADQNQGAAPVPNVPVADTSQYVSQIPQSAPIQLGALQMTQPQPAVNVPAPNDKTWLVVPLPGGESIKLRKIEPGKYMYGSKTDEVGRVATREIIQREAVVTKACYIGQYEVTQRQYEAVTGKNPSHFRSGENPVEQVSYQALVRQGGFFDLLNNFLASNGFDNLKARLPTEEEWEYACRAGTTSSFYDGTDLSDASQSGTAPDFAVCGKLYYGTSTTQKVGSLAPNKWDLYDMSGNVDEMTDKCVLRGGSWASPARDCRSAARRPLGVSFRGDDKSGFRIVIDDIKEQQ